VNVADAQQIVLGVLQGLASSTVFILALMIGFCVVVGFTKLKKTAGGVMVIKSLDEQMSHKPMKYLQPGDPRGPADQLHSPELLEATARK
jgi:hypothetical protein